MMFIEAKTTYSFHFNVVVYTTPILWTINFPCSLTTQLECIVADVPSKYKIFTELFKSTNDYDGFYLLLSKLVPLDQNSIIIDLE